MAQSSKITFFNLKELKDLKTAYETRGLSAVVPLIQKKINDLTNTELHIAVMGETGSGKSTFINAVRGLQTSDEGAAKTGPTETTMEPTSYPHPNLLNVCFWDLPGIGTPEFQSAKYVKEMNFDKYDFFIILSDCRFRENDARLAKEIEKLGKKFYFIRSKIDNDLESFHKQNIPLDKDKELDKIRNYCVSSLEKQGMLTPVFLISNFEMNEFDFPKLNDAIQSNLDDIKKHVFLLSLPNIALKIIEEKRKNLKDRIWMLATLSGAIGAVPIPGLSFVCDIGILVTAIIDFRKYLGLDDVSLQRLANTTGKPVSQLKAVVKTPLVGEINEQFVKRLLAGTTYFTISAIELSLDFIPVIGSIFGAGSSFLMTYKILHGALDDLTGNAKRVVQAAFDSDFH
ncbi:interferon-inducible GTPase 5-like [Hemiscyllium ocellatum]|uniref:interferon-inducible GTPase 5-like n=1 Tax=Hemiscyllium ocellatum TaxID=170820 RepID=UPI0029661047|nr:interferon-inducible GTPase 5-like [Hemiscyllium ocellatum]XP_060688544.1 interferon-inducible GTPase 5-like [Hemiscyllium ocellatum]XP_060688545.1 interferon-inducible GTPase 5-like [Hemiscyllium ocellatum]